MKNEKIDKQLEEIDVETTDSPDIIPIDTRETFSKKRRNETPSVKKDGRKEELNTKIESSVAEVEERFTQGCECASSCFEDLTAEDVYKHRLNVAELTKEEHDMYLMGVTMASLANRQQTHRNKERQRQRATYVYQGRKVCLEAFLYLENVTQYHLKIIRNHLMRNGVTPRVHGNMGKKPYNAFSLDMYKGAESFLKQLLAGHHDKSKPVLMAGQTRRSIYNQFIESGMGETGNGKIMGFSTFRHFMNKQFPSIKFHTSPKPHGIQKTAELPSSKSPKKLLKQSQKLTKLCDPNSFSILTDPLEILVPNQSIAYKFVSNSNGEVVENQTFTIVQQQNNDEDHHDSKMQAAYFISQVPNVVEVELLEQAIETDDNQNREWI